MMIIRLVEGLQAVCSNCSLEESARKARECFQVLSDMWVYDLNCGNRKLKIDDTLSRLDPQNL